ncbi:MAG TPA: HAMP domain-containing sensor histidine kinase [Verrucomicrobiae bacterium]|jgi:signal transduction histidine kinase
MKPSHVAWLRQLFALMEISAPDPARQFRRIQIVERNIMLPVKAVFIGFIWYSFDIKPWYGLMAGTLDVVVETVQYIFWAYFLINGLVALILLASERLPLAVVQWTVVTSGLVDGLFVGALAVVSGGLDSILFWLFVALIIRNAASTPPGFSQLALNLGTCLCYVIVGILDVSIIGSMGDATLNTYDFAPHEELGQPFALRLVVLGLTTICCYGAQALLERQRIAIEEAAEFASRESQLHSAGRLAAEFAHQIKNPLAIISNMAHSLQRAVRENKNSANLQLEIIQEEAARADKVITQIMGYSQLSEGRVEKLAVVEEINRALAQVFPAALPTGITVHRVYEAAFPPLLMQRNHLSEILVNLLQNSRDALGDTGNIFVTAHCHRDLAVEISVRDDGPGIPPEKILRVFEAYYTTKAKGSGLGLAIVKHNTELYGGTVRLTSPLLDSPPGKSGLGSGAKFTLVFPMKALPRPFKK